MLTIRPDARRSSPGKRSPPGRALDLPDPLSPWHGVVLGHHPPLLYREDAIQILALNPDKGVFFLRRRHAELPVHLRDGGQKTVGLLHRPDPSQAQLRRQAPLPGGEASFAPSPRLRRVGRNHRHARLLAPPSPCALIPPPPAAHNRSRRWRHPPPPSRHTSAGLETTDAGSGPDQQHSR